MALALVDVLSPASAVALAEGYGPPDDLTLAEWIDHGRALAARYSSVQWDISDWLAVGIERFGKDARPYLGAVTRRSPSTVRKMAALAQRFPPGRRHPGVAYSFHALVVGLPTDDADRLLDQAKRERWRYRELAGAVQARVGRRRPARNPRQRPERTLARAVARPGVAAGQDPVPVACPGCLQALAFIVRNAAIMTRGAATIQRIASGELVANSECPGCGSTQLISLAMFEIPTLAVLAGQQTAAPSLAAVGS